MMDFYQQGISLGVWWGITVRLHFTFLIFAGYRALNFGSLGFGIAYVLGLYFCILLHEFGHAFAARWCDGEAEEIILWPLGGLAFVRPAFHPTAHLITTVAGPAVTFLLWIICLGMEHSYVRLYDSGSSLFWEPIYSFVYVMKRLNFWLLIFNLIPAFPMDGGRILRDTLWYRLGAERATRAAITVSRVIAALGVMYALYEGSFMLVILCGFILFNTTHEEAIIGFEAGGTYDFSIRDRIKRGSRRRTFQKGVKNLQHDLAVNPFHQCTLCKVTDNINPDIDFRVCPDCSEGQEYCPDHIDNHSHC